jgi:hypothetical protein
MTVLRGNRIAASQAAPADALRRGGQGAGPRRTSFCWPMRRVTDQGLSVPYAKDRVKDAPNVSPDDDGHLPGEAEQALYEYYGPTVAAKSWPSGEWTTSPTRGADCCRPVD